jgi:hypothetical protein
MSHLLPIEDTDIMDQLSEGIVDGCRFEELGEEQADAEPNEPNPNVEKVLFNLFLVFFLVILYQ